MCQHFFNKQAFDGDRRTGAYSHILGVLFEKGYQVTGFTRSPVQHSLGLYVCGSVFLLHFVLERRQMGGEEDTDADKNKECIMARLEAVWL